MNLKEQTMLGRTGLKVSRLGLASGYGVPARAVEKAFHEYGINYFFWSNPRRPGMEEGLKNLVRSARERIVIALQSYDHSGLFTKRSVEKGLASMGTDYADVLILGWHNSVPWKKLMETALELKRQGKVRFLGMSGHKRATFGALARDAENPIDVFMVRYNAVHAGAEQDIFPYLEKENRPGVTIYTATCWRKLLQEKHMPPATEGPGPRLQGGRGAVRREAPLSAADCYRFVLSNPSVDLCLFGPSNEEQMRESITALDKGPLTPDEMARVRAIGKYIHKK